MADEFFPQGSAQPANPAESLNNIAQMPEVDEFLSMLRKLQTNEDGNPYYKSQGKRRLPKKLEAVNGESWMEDAKYGAYQLTGAQWRAARADLALDGFTPENQDKAAVNLLVDAGAVTALIEGDDVEAVKLASEVFPKLRTGAKKVAKLLGLDMDLSDLPPVGPKSSPEDSLPEGARDIGGEMVMPDSNRDVLMADKIAASGQSPEIQRRMMQLHNKMPSTTSADERMIGDGLPTEFDDELKAMLKKY